MFTSKREDRQMTLLYSPVPVIGYSEGLIIAGNETPTRTYSERTSEDWFVINDYHFNVHPFRYDLGGYPVRWIEQDRGYEWRSPVQARDFIEKPPCNHGVDYTTGEHGPKCVACGEEINL